MKVRVAVPRRADGGHRDRLWRYCRREWADQFPDWEIVEGHHDVGPFNRSAAINLAADGDWDVLVIADGDVLAEHDPLLEAVAGCSDGKVHLPYRRRMMVSELGTKKILRRYVGSWAQWASPDRNRNHCSSVVVLDRALWERVGGFDPRFQGWGAEDDAFITACDTLAGRHVRHGGDVWHLWHHPSPHRDHRSPLYRAAVALLGRYQGCDEAQMRALLDEDRGADQIVAAVLTTGDRPTLADTISSLDAQVSGPIGRKVVLVDGTATPSFDGWETITLGRRLGYSKAMRAAHKALLGSGQPWVFWSEDDFTFDRPVDLSELQAAMSADRHLVQMSLMRQSWYDNEIEAGGVVAADPDAFTGHDTHLTHRAYWTANPHLTCRSVLAEHEWPVGRDSEQQFARRVFAEPSRRAGVWGDGASWVTHIGDERAGHGY